MGATNCPETPRQKMIGMMYLVLMAMLALNVSADILNGFNMVDESLLNTIHTSEVRNKGLHSDMEYLYSQNPQKVGEWLKKSKAVGAKADSICNLLQQVKIEIVALADGKEADKTGTTVLKRDNIDVAGQWAGLSTGGAKGLEIKSAIDDFKTFATQMFNNDTTKAASYEKMFNTGKQKNQLGETVDWLTTTFHNMPVIAVMTMMSKYQSDIRSTEAEIINYFKAQTDASDFRVNKIMAKLIPVSKHIMQGGSFKAEIALMAIDSTKAPTYFLNGEQLDSSAIDIHCGSVGTFPVEGKIDLVNGQGDVISYPFKDEYTVGAPSATIANQELNVVYAEYNNKMEISVPGVPSEKLSVQCNGATLTKSKDGYICRPKVKSGVIKINVLADVEGRSQSMGSSEFRVRTLPLPTAYIQIAHGGKPYSWTPTDKSVRPNRKQLLNGQLIADYSDGLLKASFKVTGFRVRLEGKGGIRTFPSSGNKFSGEVKRFISGINKKIQVGIVDIKVTGTRKATLIFPALEL